MFNTIGGLPAQIQSQHLRPLAYRVLSKKYGLSIKSDGLSTLADFIGENFGIDWKSNPNTIKFMELFATIWKQQERGIFVDKEGSVCVINEIKERNKTKDNKNISGVTSKRQVNLDGFITKRNDNVSESPSSVNNNSLSPETEDEDDDSQVLNSEISINEANITIEEKKLDWKDYFKVINAQSQQKFSYDPIKMQLRFMPQNKANLPSIKDNVEMFSTRYNIVKDRVMRNEMFQGNDTFNPLSSMMKLKEDLNNESNSMSSYMSITQIKNLLGRDGKNFLLLGLLRKNNRGSWALEDPSGTIEIDISQTIPTNGLYYFEGCIVLVEGIYFSVGNRFHASSMTHPPGERREATLDKIGHLDLLGIHGSSNANYMAKLDNNLKIRLHYLEKELEDHRFVILGGDLFLDKFITLEALRKTFKKLNDDPPTVIVFQGSFTSVPVHTSVTSKSISSSTQYKNNFDTLAALLSEFENIKNDSILIFIPGANDPWGSMHSLGASGSLPQKPIPSFFTQRISRVCKRVIWGSNPMRIAYLSQEIVIMRDDMASRFKRHSVIFPMLEESKEEQLLQLQEEIENISIDNTADESVIINQLVKDKNQLPTELEQSRKYVKTILDQGHLSPFITTIRPINWELDHTLSLYPIPSTLIFCDNSAPRFDITYNGCKSINAGKFILNRRAKYLEYKPSLKKSIQQEIYF
ncbi:hypothetical protein KAFR_0B00390 [Kazachstania africana CBS 2517]|uniref:DNA polymerase epsilon subunit B n=1 Tax=Kazachstania africana (strain ATCC 22294 / BCRC 22015 / CBS 2517 / CECT 1963 / NBRC 1671 / NRRL Y-8276) TaxID=1071382 RepID=H2APN9_KAZAF|nr:hypothetical protein KAFR_0B00390 [Kazachstania africana CBS 2517]CCF56339.1 hypothetical protein KAFR_0B00390 [Kazachstania africana CBS 2517]